MSNARIVQYQALLLDQPRIKFLKTAVLKPAALLPDSDPEEPIHDCQQTVDVLHAAQPDLTDVPLQNPEEVLYTDGSNFMINGVSPYRCSSLFNHRTRLRFKKFDHRYLRKILIRENLPKSSLVSLYRKLEMKQATEMVETGILNSTAFSIPHQSMSKRNVSVKGSVPAGGIQVSINGSVLKTLSYSKYNLTPQTSEKQAKEILIRCQNTLRESMRKGHSLPWRKPAFAMLFPLPGTPFPAVFTGLIPTHPLDCSGGATSF
ncbi:Sodium/hydrogen exchanger 4 [Plecturocebus cupreus]